mmetsp:Transcript_13322/g.31492  ORF Transcript_13322/g.31492 Transcript_13322/m.31492 type:complete len:770 (+) Transcript_13322:541-2850(+)
MANQRGREYTDEALHPVKFEDDMQSRRRTTSRSEGRRTQGSCGQSETSSSNLFKDIDISRNHGHGTLPIPGRESHTADLQEFDRYVDLIRRADRSITDLLWDDDDESDYVSDGDSIESGNYDSSDSSVRDVAGSLAKIALASAAGASIKQSSRRMVPRCIDTGGLIDDKKADDKKADDDATNDSGKDVEKCQYPFNAKFWEFVRGILTEAVPVGFEELPNKDDVARKNHEDATRFLNKVIAISPLNPIQPAALAQLGGFDEEVVLAELFYGVLVGLVAMKFAPECWQCGSAVSDFDMLGRIPSRMMCNGCGADNFLDSLDGIKCQFLLNSDVLYILAENYACTPSKKSMSYTRLFAAVPATSTGSGYSYCVGTGGDNEIAPALGPGRYRMHCPVAKTDNYLVVRGEARACDEATKLRLKVSDLVYNHKSSTKRRVVEVPHGKIQFDIMPDTRSLFVLWVQSDEDSKTLMHLPEEERPNFTSASRVLHHSIFNSLFQDTQIVAVQRSQFLSIENAVLVFTDIVESTSMYANLGDGPAFKIVRKHFQVLFGAFTKNGGRVVKTIGDAVFASFNTGKAALAAVAEAMILLSSIGVRPDTQKQLEIRVGIHCGRATVVPLNGVNDYFGQTTNIAARVQSAAKSSECFVTESVLEDDDAALEFARITSDSMPFKATPSTEMTLKGVDGKVKARGFRWLGRSRRESDLSGSFMGYHNRKGHKFARREESSSCTNGDDSDSFVTSSFIERPAAMGKRRSSTMDTPQEETTSDHVVY